MTHPGIIILVLYFLFGIIFFVVLFRIRQQGRELFGRPTMNVLVQMTGKLALFVPVLVLPAAAYGINLAWFRPEPWMDWVAVAISFVAMIYLSLSVLQMGKYTKMGLPHRDEIELQTRGIYSLSRNPMYFGLFLLAIASVLYVPNPFNLLAAVIGITVHHQIILGEEKFLEKHFGEQWQSYKAKVGRYF